MSESAERIYALLIDANPFPDIDDLPMPLSEMPPLTVIDPGREDMQTQTPTPLKPGGVTEKRSRRRVWIPALAGAAALIIAVMMAAVGLFGDRAEPAPPVDEVTTTVQSLGATDPPVEVIDQLEDRLAEAQAQQNEAAAAEFAGKVAFAEVVLDDWRAGDVEGFFDRFADSGTVQRVLAADPLVQEDLAFYMAMGQELELIECVQHFGGTVRCEVVTSDQLSGSDGADQLDWIFTIADGAVVNLEWQSLDGDPTLFTVMYDMVDWVEATYPDVFAETFAPAGGTCDPGSEFNCYGTWVSSAEAAAELLRLGPEFMSGYDF